MVVAGDRVLAGRLLERALVDVELARGALPGSRTMTGEPVPPVHACPAVQTRLRRALVNVRLT